MSTDDDECRYDPRSSPLFDPKFDVLRKDTIKPVGMRSFQLHNEKWSEHIYDRIAEMEPGEERFFVPDSDEKDSLSWCHRLKSKLRVIRRQRVYMALASGTEHNEEYVRRFYDPLNDVLLKIMQGDDGIYVLRAQKASEQGFREITETNQVFHPVTRSGERKESQPLNPYVARLVSEMKKLEPGQEGEFLDPQPNKNDFIALKNSLKYAVKHGKVQINLSDFYITIRLNPDDRKYHMKIQRCVAFEVEN